jgi:hypothetical protein
MCTVSKNVHSAFPFRPSHEQRRNWGEKNKWMYRSRVVLSLVTRLWHCIAVFLWRQNLSARNCSLFRNWVECSSGKISFGAFTTQNLATYCFCDKSPMCCLAVSGFWCASDGSTVIYLSTVHISLTTPHSIVCCPLSTFHSSHYTVRIPLSAVHCPHSTVHCPQDIRACSKLDQSTLFFVPKLSRRIPASTWTACDWRKPDRW